MSRNDNISQLDVNQMATREHDVQNDAKRVILVGGDKLDISIDSDKIASAVREALSNIQMPEAPKKDDTAQEHFNVITVEKQVFIPQIEYKTIEVPVIVKQVEYKTIEVPVIVKEKEIEYKSLIQNELPNWIKFVFAAQALANLGLLIVHFIK